MVPEWEKDKPVPEGRVPLYLNPGLTFGTGSHASTQLCLEGVERAISEWLRQRNPLHRRPVPGGGIRRRGGHRPQGGGRGL